MSETEVIIRCNGEKRINICNGVSDVDANGDISFRFENTNSCFVATICVADNSEVIPQAEISYTLNKNEVYTLKGAIDAYLSMQPKSIKTVED